MVLAPVPWPRCHPSVFWQCGYFALLMAIRYFGSIVMAITTCYLQKETVLKTNHKMRLFFFSVEYTLNHNDKFQNYLLGLFQGNKAQILCVPPGFHHNVK